MGLAFAGTPVTRDKLQRLVKLVLNVSIGVLRLGSVDIRRTMDAVIHEVLGAVNALGSVDRGLEKRKTKRPVSKETKRDQEKRHTRLA